jgi:hypothetical protein
MTTTETQAPPIWPPHGCPEWCQFADNHKSADRPDDRSHMGTDSRVDLILEPSPDGYPVSVEMFLYQHVTDADATIRFAPGNWKDAVSLTLAEAAGIAANLLALCDEAES